MTLFPQNKALTNGYARRGWAGGYDDFGLQAFDQYARETLMDIIDDRFDQNSTVVASQIPVATWYDLIGEGTIADAILDRLVISSNRFKRRIAEKRNTQKRINFTLL